MLRSVLFPLACILAATASTTVAAQTLRFASTTAYPGDVVPLDVWYEAGGDAVSFEFTGRFESSLQIAAVRAGDYSGSRCDVVASDNSLRMIGVGVEGSILPDHRICSLDLRVSAGAARGWRGLVLNEAEPTVRFFDSDSNRPPGHLDGGGIYVISNYQAGTCSLVRQDMPSPDFLPESAPFCHCLRSADHPLHRCGIRFGEDFVLWREFPTTPDPRDWTRTRWTLMPLREALPDIEVQMESLSGEVWADPVRFDKGSAPLQSRSAIAGFKADGPEALDRLQVHVKFGGHAYQFEQRLRDPTKD